MLWYLFYKILLKSLWFKKNKTINMIKLRASWGKIGNLGSIGYGYGSATLSTRYPNNAGDVGSQIGINNDILAGVYMADGFNGNLTWETSEQLDFGIDALLFNNRLNLSFNFFTSKTDNLLTRQSLGFLSGLNENWTNDGELKNNGFDASAAVKAIALKDFQWEVGARDYTSGRRP